MTALRFFAALAVLASHLWELEEWPNPLQPLARTLFHEGYAGVSFFFALSGYILAHSYGGKLATGAISRRKYLALRVARIAPLHWLIALPFAAGLIATAGVAALPRALTNLALLQAWIPAPAWYFSLNEPSWSLADELFFYTAFAGLALLAPRRLAGLWGAMLLADAALVAWLVRHGHGAIRAAGAMTPTHWLTYINPLTRLVDFITGIVLYRLAWPRLGAARATLLETAAVALLLGAMIAWPWLGVAEAWRMQLAYLPLMALVIGAFGHGEGGLSRWLARSPRLVLLGDASFALYLVHLPVLHGALWLVERAGAPVSPLLFAALGTAAAIALSIIVFRVIETPVLRRSRAWIDRSFPR